MDKRFSIPDYSNPYEPPISPLKLMIKKGTSSVEEKITTLKALNDDFQLRTIRESGYEKSKADLYSQYVLNNATYAATTSPLAAGSSLNRLTLPISPNAWATKSVSNYSSSNEIPIVVREPAEEAKVQLGQTMDIVKSKIENLGNLDVPEIPKIADTLNRLLESRRQKMVRREKEKHVKDINKIKGGKDKNLFDFLLNLNTHKQPKAFLTWKSNTPFELKPLIKCLEYSAIPDPEKILYTNNNKIAFNRTYRWRPPQHRNINTSRLSSAHARQLNRESRFTVVRKMNDRQHGVERVFLWAPLEEEEMGVKGVNDFIRESSWRARLYMRDRKIRADKTAEGLDDSKLTDAELQGLIEEDNEGKENEVDIKLQEDIYNPKNAQKRKIDRNERCEDIERKEIKQTFANFYDGVDFLEFPKKAREKTLVIPADDNDPEHGSTNYYGTIQKRRATTNKFHPRWLVLKGFNLYWYRTSDSKEQKGVIKIGDKFPTETIVNTLKCFNIEEGEGRLLTFTNNENGHSFMIKVGNMICLKKYFEECVKGAWAFDKRIVNYFSDTSANKLELDSGAKINDEIAKIIGASIEYHPKLQVIELIQCEINDEQLAYIKRGLEYGNNLVTKLNLSSNNLTTKSSKLLREIIQNQKNRKLNTLILDNNAILDSTVQEIAQALTDKYQYLSQDKGTSYINPIETLSLRKTGISDKGLTSLINTFDAIATHCRNGTEDFENFLKLDIGNNEITAKGIERLAELLTKYNGISGLGISNLQYFYIIITEIHRLCKSNGFMELIKALRINESIQELDMTGNILQNTFIVELYSVLEVFLYEFILLKGKLYNKVSKIII